MKLSTGFLLTMAVLVIVITITLWSSCNSYSPYSGASGLLGSPFEGFQGSALNPKPYGYTTYPCNKPLDSMDHRMIVDPSVNESCKKVAGFRGLHCSDNAPFKEMDIYSLAQGGCDGTNSAGLSNSRGYLCLDQNQLQQLKTRGGNTSSACGSQIGAAC
jgi:hypothetical protein